MTIVDNGSTAIHLLDNNQFDVVVTDMQPPAVPCWKFLRHAEIAYPKLFEFMNKMYRLFFCPMVEGTITPVLLFHVFSHKNEN